MFRSNRNGPSSRRSVLLALLHASAWFLLGAGAEDLQWLVLATLPLQAFLSALGSNLAGAATQRLKSLVGRVRGAKPEAAAPRVLVLPEGAGALQPPRGRWRSELDESERRPAN
jgi:hypothetical protein